MDLPETNEFNCVTQQEIGSSNELFDHSWTQDLDSDFEEQKSFLGVDFSFNE